MTRFDRTPPGGCYPTAGQPPASIDDPCAYLGELRAALYALMTGRQTSQTRHGDNWSTSHPGSAVQLRAEIARLEKMCPRGPNNPHGGRNNALRAGPYQSTANRHHPFNTRFR